MAAKPAKKPSKAAEEKFQRDLLIRGEAARRRFKLD
jgi:hypothetical protein